MQRDMLCKVITANSTNSSSYSIYLLSLIPIVIIMIILILIIVLAKIINRLFHEKSTKQPYRSKGNTNL